MNAAEREKLSALIESLQGRAKHPVVTTVELMEIIRYLRGYALNMEYVEAWEKGDWTKVKKMEAENDHA